MYKRRNRYRFGHHWLKLAVHVNSYGIVGAWLLAKAIVNVTKVEYIVHHYANVMEAV